MARKLIDLPSFSSVAAGATAAIDLPVTDIYHSLRLNYGTSTAGGPTQANMESEITEIRVKVNGVVQRTMSAAQLFALNAYHGIPVNDGFLPIYFSEPWRRSAQGEDSLAWGMADVETFQVEVDIAAGATNPTLSATAVKEAASRAMGPIVKWRRFRVPVAAVGVVNVSTLPKNDAYYALHAISGNVSDVTVKVDEREVFQATAANASAYYKEQGFTPQTGYFHVDFAPTGRVADALPMRDARGNRVSDFQVDFNMSAAASFDLITETLGLRD